MTVEGLLPAMSAALNAFFLVAGVYIYASLLRQIAIRQPDVEPPPLRNFGVPEAVVAFLLTGFFLLTLSGASTHPITRMRDRDLIASAALTIGLLLALAGFLRLRRFALHSFWGFFPLRFFW